MGGRRAHGAGRLPSVRLRAPYALTSAGFTPGEVRERGRSRARRMVGTFGTASAPQALGGDGREGGRGVRALGIGPGLLPLACRRSYSGSGGSVGTVGASHFVIAYSKR